MNPNDPRVKRTKGLIQHTFAALLDEKGFESITIRDIADRATINRATFYAHYPDKYALLEEVTMLAFEGMLPQEVARAQAFSEDICRQFIEITHTYILAFYQKCKFNAAPIGVLVDGKVKQVLSANVANILQRSRAGQNNELTAAMIAAAIYSAAYYWYKAGAANNPATVMKEAIAFVMHGLQAPMPQ